MNENTALILRRYHDYLQKRIKPGEGFWDKFLRRTSFRAQEFFNKPIESMVYYTLAALPVPLWSEQDAAQVTAWFSKRVLGSKGFEPPHLPSEREEALMKSVASKEFKRFLAQDAEARTAFLAQYQRQHGKIPVPVHRILPRQVKFNLPPSSQAHHLATIRRTTQGRPLAWRKPRQAFDFR